MALDKVVDSAVLDAGMSLVADAIRAKAGTTEPLSWPDGYKSSIEAIAVGSGSAGIQLPEPQLLCTLAAEMNKNEWLAANPIPLKYKHSILFIKIAGSNIATTGNYTVNWFMHFIGQHTDDDNDFDIRCQKNGLVSPDSMWVYETIYSLNNSYASVVDNKLTASSLTNKTTYFGAGNSIYYLEIPFNFRTMTIDLEER